MRALTISAHNGLDALEFRTDLSVPEPGEGMVRVRVKAAALNHLDVFMLDGLPGVNITPPWVMGSDGAGIVDGVGPGVATVAPGDSVVINPGLSDRTCEYCKAGEQSLCVKFRLLGEHLPGTLAEFIVVPAVNVRVIPPAIPMETAAAFTLSTLTAWRMLVTRAKVTAGENIELACADGPAELEPADVVVQQKPPEGWVGAANKDTQVLVVTVPLTVLIGPGLGIQLGTETQTAQYATCLPSGCVATLPVTDKLLDQLGGANTMNLVVTAENGRAISLPVSMGGYKDAVGALNSTEGKRRSWWRRLWS